ncbi:type II toxin-antitoxin system PemK/MazF family toxin [Thermodesulfobacteriota bacterium]
MIDQVMKGDVVLCKFPMATKGIFNWKKRPGLVVSKNANNRRLDDLIIAPCSSNISKKKIHTQYFIDGEEVFESGIKISSVVRCEILMTIHKSMIIRRLGQVFPDSLDEIDDCIIDALAIKANN